MSEKKTEILKKLLRAKNPFVELYYRDPEEVKIALEQFIDLHLEEKLSQLLKKNIDQLLLKR